MQAVNYESNLQHAVITAETNARYEYYYNQSVQNFANHSSYFDIAATGFEINQMALKPYLYYASEFSDYATLYRNLGNAGRMMGTLGTAAGVASLWIDYKTMQNGDISTSRFGYHAVSFSVSVAIGASVGGVYGAAAGGLFWSGEMLYDHIIVPVFDMYWQLENGLRTLPQRLCFPY